MQKIQLLFGTHHIKDKQIHYISAAPPDATNTLSMLMQGMQF